MIKDPRVTLNTLKLMQIFLDHRTEEITGTDISRATKLSSAAVHQMLVRYEAAGWLKSHWEDINPRKEGRPQRHYYAMTDEGAERAKTTLVESGITTRLYGSLRKKPKPEATEPKIKKRYLRPRKVVERKW